MTSIKSEAGQLDSVNPASEGAFCWFHNTTTTMTSIKSEAGQLDSVNPASEGAFCWFHNTTTTMTSIKSEAGQLDSVNPASEGANRTAMELFASHYGRDGRSLAAVC